MKNIPLAGWCIIGLFLLYTIFYLSGEYVSPKEFVSQFSFHLITCVVFYYAGKFKN